MKNSLNMAVIGLGNRGKSLLEQVLVNQDDINIVALCDVYGDRVEAAVKSVEERKGNTPFGTTDYKKVFEVENLDAVLVATAWETHMEVTLYAMEKGVAVAMEVGGAYNIEELWELVKKVMNAYVDENGEPDTLTVFTGRNTPEGLADMIVKRVDRKYKFTEADIVETDGEIYELILSFE